MMVDKITTLKNRLARTQAKIDKMERVWENRFDREIQTRRLLERLMERNASDRRQIENLNDECDYLEKQIAAAAEQEAK